VATRRVLFEEKVELDIYTGATRPIRRRGPENSEREEEMNMAQQPKTLSSGCLDIFSRFGLT
jgi:hypothetical protein